MNFEVALQLFNIAVSHMKFTNVSTSHQLKAISQQSPTKCIHIGAAITSK